MFGGVVEGLLGLLLTGEDGLDLRAQERHHLARGRVRFARYGLGKPRDTVRTPSLPYG